MATAANQLPRDIATALAPAVAEALAWSDELPPAAAIEAIYFNEPQTWQVVPAKFGQQCTWEGHASEFYCGGKASAQPRTPPSTSGQRRRKILVAAAEFAARMGYELERRNQAGEL